MNSSNRYVIIGAVVILNYYFGVWRYLSEDICIA
jgi:hypothetical protein